MEAVVALGMAYALIAGNLCDRQFLAQNTLGFDDWWAPTYSNAEEIWNRMLQQGGWRDPASLETPPGSDTQCHFQFLPAAMPDWPLQVLAEARSQLGSRAAEPYPFRWSHSKFCPCWALPGRKRRVGTGESRGLRMGMHSVFSSCDRQLPNRRRMPAGS
jgi:hypothetical protein